MYEIADGGFGNAALVSDSGDLKLGCRGGDFWIEARCRGREHIHRNGLGGILFMQALGISLNAIDELLVGATEVGASGVGSATAAGSPTWKLWGTVCLGCSMRCQVF